MSICFRLGDFALPDVANPIQCLISNCLRVRVIGIRREQLLSDRLRFIEAAGLNVQPPQIELLRGHSKHDARRRGRRIPHGARVAEAAVEPHLLDPEPPPARYANRQIVSRLEDQPDRGISAGQLVAANGRQRLEHFVRRQYAADRRHQRAAGFAANRPVLEVVFDACVGHRRVGAD